MSYIINKTDGSVLTEVVDGTIDQTTTDITLVGKNSTSYGELFNENFVKILENFANTSQPNNPLAGQLWYDTTEGRLKVYDGNGFKVSGGTIVSTTAPSSIAPGDIWIDSFTQRMYFNDGSSNLLAGPVYTAQQGISGWQVIDVIDTNQINHTTVFLYVGQVLLGIFSSTSQEFTPVDPIPGYGTLDNSIISRTIKLGFNAASIPGIKFNVAASQADTLIAQDGSSKTSESFLQVDPVDGYTVSNGTIRILNSTPLVLGTNQNTEFKVASNTQQINSNIVNQNFSIQTLNSTGLLPSMFINSANKWVGLYTDAPTATLDVNGSVRIRANLTVEGNITSVNQTEINIEDIVINLGKTDSPSNLTANGGGILLEAGSDVDKTLLWSNSKAAWDSSESINIASGKSFKINNFEVLTQTQLGTTVTSAPGLNSIGSLNQLQVDNIVVNGESISYVNISIPDGNINLVPKGDGSVDVADKKITSLATPIDDTDATNKLYVDARVRAKPLAFSCNIGALTDAQLAGTILSFIFLPGDYEQDTELRVLCLDTGVRKLYKLNGPLWTWDSDY